MIFDHITALRESNGIEGEYSDLALLQAKEAWGYLLRQDSLHLEVIKQTHLLLMSNLLPPAQCGRFRTCNVWVGGTAGCPPEDIEHELLLWLYDIRNIELSLEIGTPKSLHIRYEKIHPFIDGNGRTGRMFMWWLAIKIFKEQPVVIYEKDKWEYYKWFRQEGS